MFVFRSSSEPRRRRRVGVQPEWLADVRKFADAGRSGQQVLSGFSRTFRPLSEHIHGQPARRSDTLFKRRASRTRRPERRTHQFRQRMGAQVFPTGDHVLSDLDRSSAGSLQMTQGDRKWNLRWLQCYSQILQLNTIVIKTNFIEFVTQTKLC